MRYSLPLRNTEPYIKSSLTKVIRWIRTRIFKCCYNTSLTQLGFSVRRLLKIVTLTPSYYFSYLNISMFRYIFYIIYLKQSYIVFKLFPYSRSSDHFFNHNTYYLILHSYFHNVSLELSYRLNSHKPESIIFEFELKTVL